MAGGEARNRYSWGKTEAFEGHSRAKELWVKIYVEMESETPEGTLCPRHIYSLHINNMRGKKYNIYFTTFSVEYGHLNFKLVLRMNEKAFIF